MIQLFHSFLGFHIFQSLLDQEIQDMTFAFAGQQKNTRWGRCVLVKHSCCIKMQWVWDGQSEFAKSHSGQSAQGKAMIVGFCALKMTRYKWDPRCVASFFCANLPILFHSKNHLIISYHTHTHCCKRTGAGERLEQIAGVSSQANVNTSSSHGVVKVLDLFVFKEVDWPEHAKSSNHLLLS